MKMFNHNDFDIEPEIETGNDDFIYGNYVDWDRFRYENEDNLLEYFDVSLPWGEELTILEYANFLNQDVFGNNPSLLDKWNLTQLPISKQGKDTSEISIRFPERNDINSGSIISGIFDCHGVPSDVKYEFELPEHLQYWHNILEDEYNEYEYEYYKNYPVKFITYEETINDIQLKIKDTNDELTKKSLILSSLIISESLLKSVIVEKIPTETGISEFSQNILSSEIDKQLRGNVESKNGLFKRLYKQKAPKQPWTHLRNALAHDIESSSVNDKEIVYTNLKEEKEESYLIDKLFEGLMNFYHELQLIIDEVNRIIE
ncbi:hypothetical protein JI510_01615 [Listeria monocytogenes]|uniref:hypothetical protein n=1 Tax=Listeria monocytogenes TaxID=1639 RepID=UPI001F0CFB33|nr:hypothetical protein [Listeria monocytogenes]MCH5002081.1 hypothetical protein [Listeria monocytogenes]MCH5012137.1 hypothetical protein [Listeria monocytogenes]MCH5025554.1 hypothetical protein [Listeria monocytogenes]MCH5056808.1 hypothetical protein [Listeria monocytogenes]MCH5060246.1 hypothetical protein [Listeria monocytogenes]